MSDEVFDEDMTYWHMKLWMPKSTEKLLKAAELLSGLDAEDLVADALSRYVPTLRETIRVRVVE